MDKMVRLISYIFILFWFCMSCQSDNKPKEFVGGKIVPEAENVDYHADTFLEKILMYDRDAPIFVYCFSGGRSSKAVYKMKQLGFKKIYECEGGYQKWERDGKQ